MRTFTGSATFTFRIVAHDAFTEQLRKDAQAEDSTGFLRAAHEKHPENDEAFTEMILKNGLRHNVRLNLLELFANSGNVGATVSPVKVEIVGIDPSAATPHVEPQVLERKSSLSPAFEAPYGALDPINSDADRVSHGGID